jgi:hypothetical protein
MAYLRCFELIGDGQKSLFSSASGKNLQAQIENSEFEETFYAISNSQKLDADFKTLRAEADEWHAQRTAYMMQRLETGRHPDTDTDFWNDWQEPPAPSLYAPTVREQRQRYLSIAAAVLGVLSITFLALRFAQKRRK